MGNTMIGPMTGRPHMIKAQRKAFWALSSLVGMHPTPRTVVVTMTSILEAPMMGGHISPTGNPTTSLYGTNLLRLLRPIMTTTIMTTVIHMEVKVTSPVNPTMITLDIVLWITATETMKLKRNTLTMTMSIQMGIQMVVITVMMIIRNNCGGSWCF